MAQSPAGNKDVNLVGDPSSPFSKAIRALDERLLRGEPFSGHERNCAFLNLGRPAKHIESAHAQSAVRTPNSEIPPWATISHVSGFDFDDDARAVAVTDWDNDGDLDVWVSNRTAPQVRFLRNDTPRAGDFVAFKLEGTRCNRDGIGAQVEVRLAGPDALPLVRELRAGEGFLAQSTRRMHFGLGRNARIADVIVRWPGGKQESFGSLPNNRAYRLHEGSGRAEVWHDAHKTLTSLTPGPVSVPGEILPEATLLAAPVALPRIEYRDFAGGAHDLHEHRGSPLLLVLCSASCASCEAELSSLSAARDTLATAGLRVLLGATENSPETRKVVESTPGFPSGHLPEVSMARLQKLGVVTFEIDLPVGPPQSFLLDGRGRLGAVYRGPVNVERVVADAHALTLSPDALAAKSLPYPGKWHKPPRVYQPIDLASFVADQKDIDGAYDYAVANREDFRQSIRYPRLCHLLGDAFTNARQESRAIDLYREAVRFGPENPIVMNNLAHVLLQGPPGSRERIAEALQLAEKAVRLTDRELPAVLETLARAQAASGQQADAIATAREAWQKARVQKDAALSATLQALLDQWQATSKSTAR